MPTTSDRNGLPALPVRHAQQWLKIRFTTVVSFSCKCCSKREWHSENYSLPLFPWCWSCSMVPSFLNLSLWSGISPYLMIQACRDSRVCHVSSITYHILSNSKVVLGLELPTSVDVGEFCTSHNLVKLLCTSSRPQDLHGYSYVE